MRPIDGDNLRGRVCERFLCAEPSSEEERRFAIVLGIIDSEPTITPPPNDPLTLEELREMDGEPVWITPGGFWALVIASPGERVRLICNDGERVFADKEIELVGPIYRRRPEAPSP